MLELTELEKNYPSIEFGDEFYMAKKQIKNLHEAISKLHVIVNKPESYLWDYFMKLRNELDLERELAKKQIDDHFDKLMENLNESEEECRRKIIDKNYEKIIKTFEIDLERLSDEINIPRLNPSIWNDIKSKAMSLVSEVNLVTEYHKLDLQNNQLQFRLM